MVVGLLTLGGRCGPGERSFSNAFVLLCIDPGNDARTGYLQELPAFVDWVKSARRLPGTEEILLPGEPEARRRAGADVVELDAPTTASLGDLAQRAGIAHLSGRAC
jgi:hydroxycarboxylate dehydrogenase B